MKTISLKKVAVVAVASLGFGLTSVVPANADAINVTNTAVATAPTVATTIATPAPVGAAVIIGRICAWSVVPDVIVAAAVIPIVKAATAPTVVAVSIQTGRDMAACAGTTDKSPNPSEATAIADTFFNEIVFTIFLSFSQIKDDLLSGW